MSKAFYNKVIRKERRRTSQVSDRNLRQEIASDHARVITSTAFRRLQAKAQVFSLEENASVRTRLTHSLEVSAFGRQLAQKIFSKLSDEDEIDKDLELPFVSIVEIACLLHDIGNPPFGHFGEYSIRKWFGNEWDNLEKEWIVSDISHALCKEYRSDFCEFDGNAQGFRIITKLQWHRDQFGLNLTNSLLSAYLKYLSCKPDSRKDLYKKIGFFKTEESIVVGIWQSLGFEEKGQRHPLTYIMEAADDLAYCLSDIEDGIEKCLISPPRFFKEFMRILEKNTSNEIWILDEIKKIKDIAKEFSSSNHPSKNYKAENMIMFSEFKVLLTRKLGDIIPSVYVTNHAEILTGQASSLKKADKFTQITLDSLAEFARTFLFRSKHATDIELAGHSAITGILDKFKSVLLLKTEVFRKILDDDDSLEKGRYESEKRLVWMLPKKQLNSYEYDCSLAGGIEPINRAHLIVDYVSGMTDTHAIQVYQILSGISTGIRS